MKKGIIYCIENLINNKKYIGKSVSLLKKRWYDHKSKLNNNKHGNPYLQKSWNKYGEISFTYYVLEEVGVEELSEKEKEWIKTLNTFLNGYNLTKGGEGVLGRPVSIETRKKIGNKTKGNKTWLGKKHTEETIEKMSNTKKGKVFTEMHKKNLSEAKKGKPSPRKGVNLSVETKIKISNSKKNMKDTEVSRKNKSNAQKIRWEKYRKNKEDNCA